MNQCSEIVRMNSVRFLHTSKVQCMRRHVPNTGKPPIAPPAKIMLYGVKNAKWSEPEHVKELLWRRHAYNNAVVTMRNIFRKEFEQRGTNETIDNLRKIEEEELDYLIDLNNKRSEANAIARVERDKERLHEFKMKILEDIDKTLAKEEAGIDRRTKEVKEAIRLSADFVTKENLEEKITEALENPVTFDYAIDLEGKKFHVPPPVKYIEGKPIRQKGRIYDRTHEDMEYKERE